MKTVNFTKNNNTAQLESELKESREQLRQFRFAVSFSKIKNVKTGLEIRRKIARILTRVNQIKNKNHE